MPQDQTARKDISNPAKLLRALIHATGITDCKQLSEMLAIPVRTLQRLKLEVAETVDTATANDAKHAISGAATSAISGASTANDAISGASRTHARNEPPTGVVLSKPVEESSSPRTRATDEDDVASAMIENICQWARMPEVNARQWLANTITVFGQEATARGYHTLKTKVASGEIVAKPLMFWTTTSRNEKDNAAKRREPSKSKPTIREVLAARAAEAIQ